MGQQREGITLVLQDHVSHENFVGVAQKHLGLAPYKTYPFSNENEVFEDVWITPDGSGVVHFIDEPSMSCRHLWVRGSAASRLMSQIYGLLPHVFLEDLLLHLDEAYSHHDAVEAILKIAVTCPTFDPTVFEVFKLGLQDSRTSVRNATVQAIAHSFWPESQPLLEEMIQKEPVRKVREYAQSILDQYQAQPV